MYSSVNTSSEWARFGSLVPLTGVFSLAQTAARITESASASVPGLLSKSLHKND